MRRNAYAVALIACLLMLAGCTQARAEQQPTFSEPPSDSGPTELADRPQEPPATVDQEPAPEPEPEAPEEEAEEPYEEAYYEPEYYEASYYEPTYASCESDYSVYGESGPTPWMPGYYDGHKETYYSSNVLYHYRTPEWEVDDEGFYRTEEGYYVVGVGYDEFTTTRPLGTVIETGKGEAIVVDTGYTAEPLVDFYTNW